MTIFRCEECGARDNSATTSYWEKRRLQERVVCSKCDPDIDTSEVYMLLNEEESIDNRPIVDLVWAEMKPDVSKK